MNKQVRLFTFILTLVVVVCCSLTLGYGVGASKAAADDAQVAIRLVPEQEGSGADGEPTASQMVHAAQNVSDSETQSLLQQQLDVMREQLAETKVMQSRLQVMSSACEASTSVKPAGGDKHE